jgi:hypothetical protein
MGIDLPVHASGAIGYGRIEALGTHSRLGDGHLRRALEEAIASGATDVRLVIMAEDAMRKAGRLATIVSGLADDDASGGALPRRRAAEGDEAIDDEDDALDDDDDDDDELDDDEE